MRTLDFTGYSDDVFCVGGGTKDEPDEIGCFDKSAHVVLEGRDGALVVFGEYAPLESACWVIGIAPKDEDVPVPSWPIRMSLADNGYSMKLEVDVPDDVVVIDPRAEND